MFSFSPTTCFVAAIIYPQTSRREWNLTLMQVTQHLSFTANCLWLPLQCSIAWHTTDRNKATYQLMPKDGMNDFIKPPTDDSLLENVISPSFVVTSVTAPAKKPVLASLVTRKSHSMKLYANGCLLPYNISHKLFWLGLHTLVNISRFERFLLYY